MASKPNPAPNFQISHAWISWRATETDNKFLYIWPADPPSPEIQESWKWSTRDSELALPGAKFQTSQVKKWVAHATENGAYGGVPTLEHGRKVKLELKLQKKQPEARGGADAQQKNSQQQNNENREQRSQLPSRHPQVYGEQPEYR